jgi:hypothetical protein
MELPEMMSADHKKTLPFTVGFIVDEARSDEFHDRSDKWDINPSHNLGVNFIVDLSSSRILPSPTQPAQ